MEVMQFTGPLLARKPGKPHSTGAAGGLVARCRGAAACALAVAAVAAARPSPAQALQDAPAAAVPAAAAHAPHGTLEQLYARYLSHGRGDVEMHLSPDGPRASARTHPNGDGSFTCHVSGLHVAHGSVEPTLATLLLAGVLLHEATHCQVTPYALDIRQEATGPSAQAAGSLVLLTLESISDARAVIELFRRDGAQAAGDFVALMLPRRLAVPSLGHNTAGALQAALRLVNEQPQAVHGDEQAFAAALNLGRSSAGHAVRRFMRQMGHAGAVEDAAFRGVAAALDAALERAAHAFRSGRYENNAATLRTSDAAASAGDYHFFVSQDGSIRTEPALGAEGARGVRALKTLMKSSEAPEHLLAIQWLEHEGALEAAALARARGAFGHLLRSFSAGLPGHTDQAVRIIAHTIRKTRRGEGLSALLDNAADALRQEQPSPDGTAAVPQ
jgi:hypothetical protein